jgi:hypothetical protein
MAATTAFVCADEGQHLLYLVAGGRTSEDDGGGAIASAARVAMGWAIAAFN